MKNLRLFAIHIVLTLLVFTTPRLVYAQQDWQKRLASRFAETLGNIQKFCIEKGKVECELLEIEENPPLLLQGQVIDYIGIRNRNVLYFYLVVAEGEDMEPKSFLLDSRGTLLAGGEGLKGMNLAVHIPEYTQKVFQRIKMFKGSGHIAVGILAPVGSN